MEEVSEWHSKIFGLLLSSNLLPKTLSKIAQSIVLQKTWFRKWRSWRPSSTLSRRARWGCASGRRTGRSRSSGAARQRWEESKRQPRWRWWSVAWRQVSFRAEKRFQFNIVSYLGKGMGELSTTVFVILRVRRWNVLKQKCQILLRFDQVIHVSRQKLQNRSGITMVAPKQMFIAPQWRYSYIISKPSFGKLKDVSCHWYGYFSLE